MCLDQREQEDSSHPNVINVMRRVKLAKRKASLTRFCLWFRQPKSQITTTVLVSFRLPARPHSTTNKTKQLRVSILKTIPNEKTYFKGLIYLMGIKMDYTEDEVIILQFYDR